MSQHKPEMWCPGCGICHCVACFEDRMAMSTPVEIPLARVTLDVCQACLKGEGGECHTPGCAFWMSTAPDVPLGIVFPVPEP